VASVGGHVGTSRAGLGGRRRRVHGARGRLVRLVRSAPPPTRTGWVAIRHVGLGGGEVVGPSFHGRLLIPLLHVGGCAPAAGPGAVVGDHAGAEPRLMPLGAYCSPGAKLARVFEVTVSVIGAPVGPTLAGCPA
jgi:hypothetical protein